MPSQKNQNSKTVEPMEAVKRLLVLQLYSSGVATKDIGHVLGVSYKTIERIVPTTRKKKKDN